jgi:hypothetical protein
MKPKEATMKKAISVAILSLCLATLIGCQDEQASDLMFQSGDYQHLQYGAGPRIIIKKGSSDSGPAKVEQDHAYYVAINARGIIEADGIASKHVDFLVMDVANFNLFKEGVDFAFRPEASELNATDAQYSFESGGVFYYVINNAGGIEGGAVPDGLVDTDLSLYGDGEVLEGPAIIHVGQ